MLSLRQHYVTCLHSCTAQRANLAQTRTRLCRRNRGDRPDRLDGSHFEHRSAPANQMQLCSLGAFKADRHPCSHKAFIPCLQPALCCTLSCIQCRRNARAISVCMGAGMTGNTRKTSDTGLLLRQEAAPMISTSHLHQ